jgi:hypothetical protein
MLERSVIVASLEGAERHGRGKTNRCKGRE